MTLKRRITDPKEWERVRAGGYRRWILWRGIVGFALPIWAVGLLIITYSATPESSVPWWVAAIIVAILSLDGGYMVADWAWHKYERTFSSPPKQP